MKDKVSWEELLGSSEREGDSRWARLVLGSEMEVEAQVRDLEQNPPTSGAYVMVVRGERCRDSESLFREFDRAWESFWGILDSGDNWDEFGENLEDLVAREREGEDPIWWGRELEKPNAALVLILRSPELLRDEPVRLQTLIESMRSAAFGLDWEDKDRPRIAKLNIIFQCEPEESESLKELCARAGLDLQ